MDWKHLAIAPRRKAVATALCRHVRRPLLRPPARTCLDLGEAGALFTRERKAEMVGDVAKTTKQEINTVWIYPPKAERAAALTSADPERVTSR
ncbi:hypothetical protein AXW67_23630 [Bradyrhizobium neotropicale]|uniref:Uncharacterized protein n=1 Tax=Bradyrhizobium neotropicale TaxID=1497615 RepID=A0A176YUY2_9BRAD|nr:hypothetical protein AXW67_23630 [Bradyrhizobium neotropicale]